MTNRKPTKTEKQQKCKGFCKTVRRSIYPHIDFDLAKNCKYGVKDLLDALVHTALNHDFTHNGCETLRVKRNGNNAPSSWSVNDHIAELDKSRIEELFGNVFEAVYRLLKSKNLMNRRTKMDVAIDITDGYKYYGKLENAPMVVGTKPEKGTQWAYKFASVTIVVAGFRFTLLTFPVSPFGTHSKLIEELLTYAKKKISIGTVYLDRGFFGSEVINTLDSLGVKYVMAAPASQAIKKFVGNDPVPKVYDYTIRSSKKDVSATFKLLAVQSNRDPEQTALFATNLDVSDDTAQLVSEKYSKRWGIETAFRVQDGFLVRTTSKNYSVRLFDFLLSVCLYNLWILTNIIVALLSGSVPEKPIITSKMFLTMLYDIVLNEYG